MIEEGCRPALDFARLAKLKPDGTLDWDCESRSAPRMEISRLPEQELSVVPVSGGVDGSAAEEAMPPEIGYRQYLERLVAEETEHGLSSEEVSQGVRREC